MGEFDFEDFEAFVERMDWTFAKSMPQIPHWYVIRGRDCSEEEFDAAVAHVKEAGYLGRWRGRKANHYLEVGGYRYWALPGRGSGDTLVVLNREEDSRPGVERVE